MSEVTGFFTKVNDQFILEVSAQDTQVKYFFLELYYIRTRYYFYFQTSLKLSFLSSKFACGRQNSSLNTLPRQLTIMDIFYRFQVLFSDLRILHRTVVLFNRYINALTQEENTITSLSLYQPMLYEALNSSNTTGSTYNLVSMLRSTSLYRALKKLNFRQLPLLGFSGTFDMLQKTCS